MNLVSEGVILRSETIRQLGFFDADRRLAALSEKGDPLEAIASLVPWESFRADIEAVVLTPEEAKKSKAGRKPLDALVLFRMLVLQALYNLSDEQIEYQVRDRLSFKTEPPRDFRRLQLLRKWSHDEADEQQVFT